MNEIVPYKQQRDSWVFDKAQCEHMVKLATNLHASGILPSYVKSPQVAFALMVKAHALGLPEECAWDFLYENPYNKKIELATTAKVALIAKAGGVIKTKEYTGEKVSIECFRPNWGTETFTFTIADAQKAGLTQRNQNYSKYPAEMLWARAVSRAASRMFPDVILGIDGGEFEMGHSESGSQHHGTSATPLSIAEKIQQEVKELSHEGQTQTEHQDSQSEINKEAARQARQTPTSQSDQKEEAKTVPESSPEASQSVSKTNRRRARVQPDTAGPSGADLEARGRDANDGAANSESLNDNISAADASGDALGSVKQSDSNAGLRAGLQGSPSEGQVGQPQHALPSDPSENPEFRHLKANIESRIPGATVTGGRLGRFGHTDPEHLKLVSVAATELMLSVEFKKQHGATIIKRLDEMDIDATQEAVTAAVRQIVNELVPF